MFRVPRILRLFSATPHGRCRSLPPASKRTPRPLRGGHPRLAGPATSPPHSATDPRIPILIDAIRMPSGPAAQPPPRPNATWRPSEHPSAPRQMTAMWPTRNGGRPPLTAYPRLPPSTGEPNPSTAQPSRHGPVPAVRGHARTCRCERVPSAHSYAEVSIFIRDQPCCERYVAETGTTLRAGQIAEYERLK
jgi:hypothetical protein